MIKWQMMLIMLLSRSRQRQHLYFPHKFLLQSPGSLQPEPCSESFGSTLFVCLEGLQSTYVCMKPPNYKKNRKQETLSSRKHRRDAVEGDLLLRGGNVADRQQGLLTMLRQVQQEVALNCLVRNLLAMLICHLGTLEREQIIAFLCQTLCCCREKV